MRSLFGVGFVFILFFSREAFSVRVDARCQKELFMRLVYDKQPWLGKKVWVPRGPGKPPAMGVIYGFDDQNRAEVIFVSESNKEPGTFSTKGVDPGQLKDLVEATPSEIARSPHLVDGKDLASFESLRPGDRLLVVSGAEEVYPLTRVIENKDGWMTVEVFNESGQSLKTLRFYRKGVKAILRFP